VDQLLNSDIFSWVFLHSYSCVERVKSEFSHIITKSNVIHNAAPKDILEFGTEKVKSAIFNRNLSWRRRLWLWPSGNMIDRISGRYGEDYFTDLREANIAVNIHYSRQNLDDFESGIFEAMASGCAVISESLNHQTLVDLGMEDAILQVNSPFELKEKIRLLNKDEKLLRSFQTKSQQVIQQNTWHDRAQQIIEKFEEIYN
jgi:glycosyltransferase involved in cell wall biosynthesis